MKYYEYTQKREEAIEMAAKLIDLIQPLEVFTDSRAMLAHNEYINLVNNDGHIEDIDFQKHHRSVMRYENEKYYDTLRLLKRLTGVDYKHLD
jgi:hypothetical protein